MSDTAIRVRSLRKTYPGRDGPVYALSGVDLEVKTGECFGLLGPNGAGKTTTVEILEGLNRPTLGDVEIFGMSWDNHASSIRERIGVTLQETRFPDKETVRELIRLFRSFYKHGIEPDLAMKRVALESKANALVETLSGGQQRRLAVALALVGDPELLFLDEPTTGLDPQSRRQLWEVIRDLRAQGSTILLTTHYMDEAERLCDRVAIIDQGKVIAQGSPVELIARLGGEHIIEFALPENTTSTNPDQFTRVEGVLTSRVENDAYILSVSAPHRALPALLAHLEQNQLELARLTTRHASLEDVFVSLTGRHLRDNEEPPAAVAAGRRGRGRRARPES